MGPSEEKTVCARGCFGFIDGDILMATRMFPVLKRAAKVPRTGGRAGASKLRCAMPYGCGHGLLSASEAI